jgi:hypothetical protein
MATGFIIRRVGGDAAPRISPESGSAAHDVLQTMRSTLEGWWTPPKCPQPVRNWPGLIVP